MSTPRVVWITGASSGIGRALVQEFAARGDRVVATARNVETLEQMRDGLTSGREQCSVYACDVRDAQMVQRLAENLAAEGLAVDILVNNAGVTYFKEFSRTSPEEFNEIIETNLRGVFLTTQSVLQGMIGRGRGTIINILSYAGKTVYTGSSVYAASKAGAEALMSVLRAETRDKGIKIVNVYPGAVLTPIWNPKVQERYGDRMMKPEEIGRLIYEISCQPPSMMVEDVVIRPQGGDLKV